MITERTLKRWRKEALEMERILIRNGRDGIDTVSLEMTRRIKKMTQVLLDQHLMKGK